MRKLLKACLGLLLLAVLLIVALGFYMHGDEPLSVNSKAMLERVEQSIPDESRAYFYLLGFNAPSAQGAEQGPIHYGRQRFEQVKKTATGTDFPIDERFYTYTPLPCIKAHFVGCFEPQVLQVAKDNLVNNAQLFERYQQLIALDDFAHLTAPTGDEPLPDYVHLMAGSEMVLQSILLRAEAGDLTKAQQDLDLFIKHQRHWLAQSDNLLIKFVSLRTLTYSFELRHALNMRYALNLTPLAPLSKAERDLYLPMAREYAMMDTLYQQFADAKYAHLYFSDLYLAMPKVIQRLFYKPNMTSNYQQYPFQLAAERSQQTLAQYLAASNEPQARAAMSEIQNMIGVNLVDVATPHYLAYVEKIRVAEIQILLMNAVSDTPVTQWQARVKTLFPSNQVRLNQQSLCVELPKLKVPSVCIATPSVYLKSAA
ncbi:hypothetical protein VST7929_03091 [Vibrio stylophorae]|uniref:Uncharacterized protein n=1 Tax=Vibrio stylophorae TaxID=659351 RepID=A0ABM8ZXP1_9VIBR|nr:hypothetical protein [Vibrio stylophorae]CAH0535520.1 hypothetical protein VST7929_03091 [Vibrio stylophorae]